MNCERLSGCITTRTLYFSGRFGTLLARYGTRSSLPWPLGHLAWGIILSFINRLALLGMSWTPIITGGFVGPAFVMYSTLKKLYDYDNHTAGLRRDIENAQQALNAS